MEELNLEFVLIPAGEFIMGSDFAKDKLAQIEETPPHTLNVTDFYIMRFPVTNAQYRIFVEETGHRPPRFWPEDGFPEEKADHPVVGVTFIDSLEFCLWAGKKLGLPLRLPTEPEWEKAARGPDGLLFPWGNDWEEGVCNSIESKNKDTTPVDKYSPQGDSPYGVADMGGNAAEWCGNLYRSYPYDSTDGREIQEMDKDRHLLPKWKETGCVANPQQIEAGYDKQTIRGGMWRQDRIKCRGAYRSWAAPLHRSEDTGFRCCYEP